MPLTSDQRVVDEFRARGGQAGEPFACAPLILLPARPPPRRTQERHARRFAPSAVDPLQ